MKILLVDDDPAVLQTLLAILKRNPALQITVGTNGPLAIENASSAGGVDLLITDVVMEPTDGFTLRQQLAAQYPALRAIFISGYDLSDYAAHTQGCDVFAKPVDADALLAAVAKVQAELPPPGPKPPRVLGAPRAVSAPTATPVAQPAATPVAQPTATPVAQPTATPVAQPKATPVAQPTATPVAQPTATPVAQPTATPVAQPTATPVAQPKATPVAQPKATPVAQPKAMPSPKPVVAPTAQPKATPTAQPTAAPVAQPQATPTATPVAQPQATPTATPVAQPQATPTATPVAQPKATPVVAQPKATPAVAVPVPDVDLDEEIFGSDDLLNKRVGNYNIVWRIGGDEWGPVYVAVQTSMARPVAMKVLSEEVQNSDPTAKQRFIALARAKAAVKHATILSVYEAGEASGHTYYTYEYVDGVQLEEAREQGRTLGDPLILRIIKVVAEGMAYLQHQKIPYAPLEARRIYLGKDDAPHLGNLAVASGEAQQEAPEGIAALAEILAGVLPGGQSADPRLQALLDKMRLKENGGILSWGALQQAVKALEPKVVPVDAIKLTAQEEAAIRAVEAAKKQQKKTLILTTVGVFALLWVVAGLVWWKFFYSNERDHSAMIEIPAGEFIFQDGQKAHTDRFWIDKYEVTMGQYARFLDYLAANPTTEFDHPDQPKGKNHFPKDKYNWDIYYGRARAGKPARYVPIDLNCPIFNVDYWDAYAYAKWAGKRLPTEKEWEKAARGTKGFLYPWGNKFDPNRVNSGADYEDNPGPNTKPKVDGYVWWSPVDAIPGDESPYGVIGMGGNVAEWAETSDTRKPVARGGSYANKLPLTNRVTEIIPEHKFERLGFRCVSDHPPK